MTRACKACGQVLELKRCPCGGEFVEPKTIERVQSLDSFKIKKQRKDPLIPDAEFHARMRALCEPYDDVDYVASGPPTEEEKPGFRQFLDEARNYLER